jgi:hypothetical protein
LRLPLFKIGSTSIDLLQRLADLGADRYAAACHDGGNVAIDAGFDRWTLVTIDYTLPRVIESPVWVEPRALRVKLPKWLSTQLFEERFREALEPISLAKWLKTEEAQIHLAGLGRNRSRAERFTPYAYGERTRLSRADEIYLFRPRIDMPWLCRAAELIVQEAAAN